jgi:tetratricopeptide (TPR) repeat protein
MPSTVGYMILSGGLSFALFLVIWFWLRADGDEAPWIPAGLAAGFVVLIAAAAREIVMRRAWARYTREMELAMGGGDVARPGLKTASGGQRQLAQSSVAALRALQQRLAELDAAGSAPESHLEAFRLCEQFLANADEALRTVPAAEMRAALRAGQERVRALKRKHLLLWARGESTRLTAEAQKRVRAADKIETAQGALEVLDEALRLYPDARELHDSSLAVRDFVASVKVGQWVEMAERAAFRGRYQRAIARYRDALFYLSRAEMGEEARHEAAARIQREIEMLRARLDTNEADGDPLADPRSAPRVRGGRRKREFAADAHLDVDGADEREEAEL